jgi:hypothetical protein
MPGRVTTHARIPCRSARNLLLGYHAGRAILQAAGESSPSCHPASLLVQHLGTPDMVLSLLAGRPGGAGAPAYARETDSGVFNQASDLHFPARTQDPGEILDPTFYTRRPATSPRMNAIINRYGGDGIVVSRFECAERYGDLRDLLAGAGQPIPADSRDLREWSLVMALTGTFNAVDRGLIEPECDLVIHGSGSYGADDYRELPEHAGWPASTSRQIAEVLLAAPHSLRRAGR